MAMSLYDLASLRPRTTMKANSMNTGGVNDVGGGGMMNQPGRMQTNGMGGGMGVGDVSMGGSGYTTPMGSSRPPFSADPGLGSMSGSYGSQPGAGYQPPGRSQSPYGGLSFMGNQRGISGAQAQGMSALGRATGQTYLGQNPAAQAAMDRVSSALGPGGDRMTSAFGDPMATRAMYQQAFGGPPGARGWIDSPWGQQWQQADPAALQAEWDRINQSVGQNTTGGDFNSWYGTLTPDQQADYQRRGILQQIMQQRGIEFTGGASRDPNQLANGVYREGYTPPAK